jgi:hypothetical protein
MASAGVVAVEVARLEGIEPPTHGLEGRCSVRLSYRRVPVLLLTYPKSRPSARATITLAYHRAATRFPTHPWRAQQSFDLARQNRVARGRVLAVDGIRILTNESDTALARPAVPAGREEPGRPGSPRLHDRLHRRPHDLQDPVHLGLVRERIGRIRVTSLASPSRAPWRDPS